VNWGRVGIGLEPSPEFETHQPIPVANGHLQASTPPSGRGTPVNRDSSFSVNIDDPIEMNTFTSRSKANVDDRRPLLQNDPQDEDHPDQKYARRFAGERNIKIRSIPRSVKRMVVMAVFGGAILFLFLFFGRRSAQSVDDNPLFDPNANPNIRIADS